MKSVFVFCLPILQQQLQRNSDKIISESAVYSIESMCVLQIGIIIVFTIYGRLTNGNAQINSMKMQ